jgi:hypothetical protein
MNGPLRHHCRYQPCRLKLAEPVDNIRRAFCSPGCHASFYKRRCLVCERPFAEVDQGRTALVGARKIKRREGRRFCGDPKCAAAHRENPENYQFRAEVAPRQVKASETPIK